MAVEMMNGMRDNPSQAKPNQLPFWAKDRLNFMEGAGIVGGRNMMNVGQNC